LNAHACKSLPLILRPVKLRPKLLRASDEKLGRILPEVGDTIYKKMGRSLRVQLTFEDESESTIALQGLIEVPRMPAVGDRFTHNNIKDGRAVRLYGEVMKLVPQPPQNRTGDA